MTSHVRHALWLSLLALFSLFTPAIADEKAVFPLPWPIPDGWRGETIAFPLAFAPTLAYEGLEELRFSPGFFKPEQPDYFTYAFVWLVDDTIPMDQARLTSDLQAYFSGLMDLVASDKDRKDRQPRESTRVTVLADATEEYHGTIETWDAFTNGQKLKLQFRANAIPSRYAMENHQKIWYFEVSPRLPDPDIQSLLKPLRSSLKLQP